MRSCPKGRERSRGLCLFSPPLTHDQTRYIFETNTIGIEGKSIRVDDIVETTNHFCCLDLISDRAEERLTEGLIKELYTILKSGTSDSRKKWFAVGG